MELSAEMYAKDIIDPLKDRGFKKAKLTWYRSDNDITILLNIQKSQYSKEIWYYNLGFGINQLHEKAIHSIYACDIIYRLDQRVNGKWVSGERLIAIFDKWIEKYGSLEELRTHAIEGTLPGVIGKDTMTFLTTVVFSSKGAEQS